MAMIRPEEMQKLEELRKQLASVKRDMTGLTKRMVGMVHDNLTTQVNTAAGQLAEIEFELDKAINSIQSHTIQDAEQNSKNVLDAALAGIELAERRLSNGN